METKSKQMVDVLDELGEMVFGSSRTRSKQGRKCISCKGEATTFRDALSRREYEISALCQKCQDEIFSDPEA